VCATASSRWCSPLGGTLPVSLQCEAVHTCMMYVTLHVISNL
jgi:hypothetical protein